MLDEVTYIKDWDKGVKFLADAGLLDDVVLLLTGSDSVIIREVRMRLPGRRSCPARGISGSRPRSNGARDMSQAADPTNRRSGLATLACGG